MVAVGMVSDVCGIVPVQSATKEEKEQLARAIMAKAGTLQELKQLTGFQKPDAGDGRSYKYSTSQIEKLPLASVRHIDKVAPNKKLFKDKTTYLLKSYFEAYERDFPYRNYGVSSNLGTDPTEELEKFTNLVYKILQREAEYSKNYYVFYHSHDRRLAVIFDVYKLLNKWLETHPVGADILLRNRTMGEFKDINEFMDYWEKRFSLHSWNKNKSYYKCILYGNTWNGWHDGLGYRLYGKERNLGETLLSVNLSLFGNLTQIDTGNSSFDYFLRSKSICAPKDLLGKIFIKWGFESKYKDEVLNRFWAKNVDICSEKLG